MSKSNGLFYFFRRARVLFRKIRRAGLPLLVLVVALLRPLIANDQPLIARQDGSLVFPAFAELPDHFLLRSERALTRNDRAEVILRTPIPFHPQRVDLDQRLLPPGSEAGAGKETATHWLGTDHLGRDVAAGICQGLYIAVLIGIGSMLLAFLLGVPLGWVAAWDRQGGLRLARIPALVLLLVLPLKLLSLGYWMRGMAWSGWQMLFGFAASLLLLGLLFRAWDTWSKKRGHKTLKVPLAAWIEQGSALIDSVPGLVWVLCLGALFGPGILVVLLLITWVRLPETIRLSTLEAMRIQSLPFSEAAVVAGVKPWRLWTRHWWPAQWPLLQVLFLFGAVSAILLESALSFLGLGLPVAQVSWGSLISGARGHMDAWWLVLFPGLFLVLYIQWIKRWAKRLERGAAGRKA